MVDLKKAWVVLVENDNITYPVLEKKIWTSGSKTCKHLYLWDDPRPKTRPEELVDLP